MDNRNGLWLFIIIVVAILVAFWLAPRLADGSTQTQPVVTLINEYRVSKGLAPLTESPTMDQAATAYSETACYTFYLPGVRAPKGATKFQVWSNYQAEDAEELWEIIQHNSAALGFVTDPSFTAIGVGVDTSCDSHYHGTQRVPDDEGFWTVQLARFAPATPRPTPSPTVAPCQ